MVETEPNMKKIFLIIAILLISPITLLGEEWKVESKQFSFGCSCQKDASDILARLKSGLSGDRFYLTEEGRLNNQVLFVLSSWQDYMEFNGKIFKSDFLDTFEKEFFNDHRLAVVKVITTGTQFIKNDKLYKNNEGCGLSYEIWDKKSDFITFYAGVTLYVIQLKK